MVEALKIGVPIIAVETTTEGKINFGIDAETEQCRTVYFNEFAPVYETYRKLVPEAKKYTYSELIKLGLNQLEALIITLKKEIDHENSLRDIEKKIEKGAFYYFPEEYIFKNPFDVKNFNVIKPDPEGPYRQELNKALINYFENSHKVDEAIICFSKISENFAKEASINIKEIFDLQKDDINKFLERIPKLGIIPKGLRIKEQIRLMNCIINDYKAVYKKFVEEGVIPILKLYIDQEKTLHKYIDQHPTQDILVEANLYKRIVNTIKSKQKAEKYELKTISNEKHNNLCKEKIKNTKMSRLNAVEKIVNNFINNGVNINKTSKNIKKNGAIDLARKTVFALLPIIDI